MTTTSRASQPASLWHERGHWGVREDRIASAVWLSILWAGMITGFGLDFARYLAEKPAAPWIVHVHAVVFTGWMFLITAQVVLVMRNHVALHRRLGWVAAGWACLMAILGPLAVMASQATAFGTPSSDPQFVSTNIVDIIGFVLLTAWGLALRKNPAAHRRIMILATVSLADPGFSRLSGWFIPQEPRSALVWFFWCFYGNVFLIALMTAWDIYRRRLMRSFVLGAALLIAAESCAAWLYFYPPWIEISGEWVRAWVSMHAFGA